MEERVEKNSWFLRKLNELLWTCSGADKRILRKCPTDYAKYAGIGGTILFTALMAMLSGGYAVYKIFSNEAVAVCFGIFWGLLIFNLDRFMVNTMYSDGTHRITKEELKGGMPRIILAIFLGIVISTPIEMRIFQDQIKVVAQQKRNEVKKNLNVGTKELYEERDKYQKEIDKAGSDWNIAEEKAQNEYDGTGGSKTKGAGISYNEKRKEAELKEDIYRNIERKNKPIIAQIDKEISEKRTQDDKNVNGLKGFAAELDALYSMKGTTLLVARLLVSLLFIAIEVIPTLFKMMMSSGPYDDLRRAEMHRVRVLSDKEISDINDYVNTQVKISVAKNKATLEAEQAANKELLEKLALAQTELLQTAIDEWKARELAEIRKDPSKYLKTERRSSSETPEDSSSSMSPETPEATV